MPRKSQAFPSDLPAAPDYNPVRKAIEKTGDRDPEIAAALSLFASMPPSTGIFANPARYHHAVECDGTTVELNIRSFAIRGCLLEEDVVRGAADAVCVIFVGLFDRFPTADERKQFSKLLSHAFTQAVRKVLPPLAKFMKSFPYAHPDVAMQYMSALRNATERARPLHPSRPAALVLTDMVAVHMENVAVAAGASYMRAGARPRDVVRLLESLPHSEWLSSIFSLLLRRHVDGTEARILENLGAIQVHHGSAGSNMVARYLASLHTRSISDLFTAAQMTLDCARHFGAITDLTDFITELHRVAPTQRDGLIRQRAMQGNLPAFGHPEIAAAGRSNSIEVDPRPAIYLAPLFEAMDAGRLVVPRAPLERIRLTQRMYQIAFVEGLEKPGRVGRLRIAPNTDFGAWIVQEALGIDEADRTLLSYVFRGFGWMMDVREQLQQPIIRPVIPPDPAIVPSAGADDMIPKIVEAVHKRLSQAHPKKK
ncbi:MAG TPA: citrate/2-methylcitrate synthase [Terriglobia bacterium]|nr:citrate/2-methylcitrate synthase [Terriglobia bacterium]